MPKHCGHVRILLLAVVALLASGCVTGVPESDVANLYFTLGKAYFDLGQFDNAVKAYAQALEYDPSLAKAGYNLAHVYLETGRISDAKDILEDLLDDDPENTIVLSTLGWAYYLEGNLTEALAIYQRVSDRLSGDVDALFNTATLLWRLERYDEALDTFLELREIDPTGDYVPSIAELYELLGESEQAIAYWELYVTGHDDSTAERLRLAHLYASARDYGKAVRMYSDAIDRLKTPDANALFERAKILLVYIEDFELGLKELVEAFDAGYSDEAAVSELAAEAPAEVKTELVRLVEERGFAIEEPGTPDSQIEGR